MTGTARVLPPLPRIVSEFDRPDRRLGAPDRQGLGDAQAGAIEQGENGGVTRGDPGRSRLAVPRFAGRQFARLGRSQRLGQDAWAFRCAHLVENVDSRQPLAAKITREGAKTRQLPQQRARADALLAPPGHEGAQIAQLEAAQRLQAERRFAKRATRKPINCRRSRA